MALDNQNERQNIIGKINSIMATLDFDVQLKKERQNADAWKKLFRDLGQTVGNITDNPIPFLLGLIKLLKAKSNKTPKSERAQQRGFRRAEKKKRRKEDKNSSSGSTTSWMSEKHPKMEGHLKNVVGEEYGRILRDIIIKCVKRVVPKIPDMLVEEILRAFNCDLNMEVPVVGDGLTTDIVVRVDQIDLFKQLKETPDEGVGKFYYEINDWAIGYPPGTSPFSVNRFLKNLIENPGSWYPVYGASGLILFTIKYDLPFDSLVISPHYKSNNNSTWHTSVGAGQTTALGVGAAAPSTPGFGVRFTFAELIRDYFDNIKVFELPNLLGALLEILAGLSISFRNDGPINFADALGVNKLIGLMNKIMAECDGMDLGVTSTDSIGHLSELFDDDSFFSFTMQEDQEIYDGAKRKSKGVMKFETCDNIEIPLDLGTFESAADDIIATLQQGGDGYKAFDMILQNGVEGSVAKMPDPTWREKNWNWNIHFCEELILQLPQIMMLAIMSSKVILPIVIVAKCLNENQLLASNPAEFAKIFKRLFIRICRAILAEIVKEMWKILKQYLIKVLLEFAKKLLETKLGKRAALILGLIAFLLPFIDALQNAKNCKEILDTILKLIDATGIDVPFSPPPQFLIFAASARSGTNPTRTFQKYVLKLEEMGVPTGDMPSGAPNLWILSMFAAFQAQDDETTRHGVGHGTTYPTAAPGPPGAVMVPPTKTLVCPC